MNIATGKLPLLCLCASLFALVAEAATNMTPVALTGWNRDVIVESTAVGPPFTAYAAPMNSARPMPFTRLACQLMRGREHGQRPALHEFCS